MVITSKGQITIPKEYRELLGLLPYTEVEFELVDGALHIKKAEDTQLRGQKLIEHMTAHSGALKMTTDEIMQLTRGE